MHMYCRATIVKTVILLLKVCIVYARIHHDMMKIDLMVPNINKHTQILI